MKYIIIAASFSGNKGAASMLEASIQQITRLNPQATFDVWSIYPEEDKVLNSFSNANVIGAKPLVLMAINLLAVLYKIIPPLRPSLMKNQNIQSLVESDVVLDQAGISFVDGRTKFVIYNVLTLLPALLIHTPVIKCSQAMGPFNDSINKLFSRMILPRLDQIFARGDQTYKNLSQLHLENVQSATDLAFLLEIDTDSKKRALEVLNEYGIKKIRSQKTIAMMPSQVVYSKLTKTGIDYIAMNQKIIKQAINNGDRVVLMAYSARSGQYARHNNDLPVCRDIAKGISKSGNFTFIDDELSAQTLRHIIGQMDMVVTSRFHAMIAALCMSVPPMVIGWSHKYHEIMIRFGLEELVIDYNKVSDKLLVSKFNGLLADNKRNTKIIEKHLPMMRKDSMKQINYISSRKYGTYK